MESTPDKKANDSTPPDTEEEEQPKLNPLFSLKDPQNLEVISLFIEQSNNLIIRESPLFS